MLYVGYPLSCSPGNVLTFSYEDKIVRCVPAADNFFVPVNHHYGCERGGGGGNDEDDDEEDEDGAVGRGGQGLLATLNLTVLLRFAFL